jgi:phospholipase C
MPQRPHRRQPTARGATFIPCRLSFPERDFRSRHREIFTDNEERQMAFHKDYECVIAGNSVFFSKDSRITVASLPRSQGTEIEFKGVTGRVTVVASALNINDPWREEPVGPQVDPTEPTEGRGSTVETWNHVPLLVELFAPSQAQPVASWRTLAGWQESETFTFQHTIGTAPSLPGMWRCRVTNKGTVSATTDVRLHYNYDRAPLRTLPIPRVLVDHAYQLILEALTPKARISGRKVLITFNSELIEYFGEGVGEYLQPPEFDLPYGIEGEGDLQEFVLDASTGGELQYAMSEEWRKRRNKYQTQLEQARNRHDSAGILAAQKALEKNDAWKADWDQRVAIDHPALHAHVCVSKLKFEREFDLLIFGDRRINIAEITNVMVDIYIAFDPSLQRVSTLVLTPAEITGGLLDLAEDLGLMPNLNDMLADTIVPYIDKAAPYLCRYLAEAMGKLAARESVFMRMTADQVSWRVQYTRLPIEVWVDVGDGLDAPVVVGEVTRPDPTPPGPMPPEFLLVAPPGSPVRRDYHTQQLDKVDHFVVVMMENRSFDHMLGYLGLPDGSRVEGVRGRHSNPLRGRTVPVQLRPAREIVREPVTKIMYSPSHSIDHVELQIADGEMSGFAQDFDNGHPGFGEYVMTYYTGEELTCYDRLAREHTVCDHWFAAFPGGTWPNRWSTLSGSTPDLRNLELDDTRIGFLEGTTILDVMSAHGIDWRVYESDLSLVRTYAKYRLDTTRVVPYYNRYDATRGFDYQARNGLLPAVTFVEPNFRDIPPLSTANDDLAPANLLRGQEFIARVVDSLSHSPKWGKTMLLITYDEHGGFYDHVPPPGTAKGPPEWLGKVPPLIATAEKECDYMGVRVPAIVVSPLAASGGVCKQVFDHCSIIKTILLRHRQKFPTKVFTQFGPRVNIAADLGLALSPPAPPSETARAPISRSSLATPVRGQQVPTAPFVRAQPARDDFHEVLRRGFLPKRRIPQLPTTPVVTGSPTRK